MDSKFSCFLDRRLQGGLPLDKGNADDIALHFIQLDNVVKKITTRMKQGRIESTSQVSDLRFSRIACITQNAVGDANG
jgi:hypothetical protein